MHVPNWGRVQLPSIRLENQGIVYAEISGHILRILRGEYLGWRFLKDGPGQSTVLGAHQRRADQRPSALRVKPPSGWVRGQAPEFQIRETDEVLAVYRPS